MFLSLFHLKVFSVLMWTLKSNVLKATTSHTFPFRYLINCYSSKWSFWWLNASQWIMLRRESDWHNWRDANYSIWLVITISPILFYNTLKDSVSWHQFNQHKRLVDRAGQSLSMEFPRVHVWTTFLVIWL